MAGLDRQFTRRSFAGLLGASALAVVVAACGSDDNSATSSSPTTTEGATTSAATGSTAAGGSSTTSSSPSSTPTALTPNGTLRYGRVSDVTSWDPHKSSVGTDGEVLFAVYDRLVHVTPNGELIPGLAESFETSADGLTLTLKIRPDVTFHDGATLDANVVKANLDRALTVEGSTVKTEIAGISEVVVVDPMTVDIKLKAPQGNMAALLSDRAGCIISPNALTANDLATKPVGAGMYKVTSYEPKVSADMVKHGGYWDPTAQGLEGIKFQVFADPSALYNALSADQLDFANVDSSRVEDATSDGLNVKSGATRQIYYLNLNKIRPGLDNLQVRQAIAHAIDREGMVKSLMFGQAEPASQLIPPGDVGANPSIPSDAYGYDVDKAKELMDSSGVDPSTLTYELINFAASPVPEINEVIAENLKELGINVNITTVEVTAVADTYFVNKKGDMMQGPWSGRPSAEQTIQLLTTSTGFANPSGWAPDGFDQAYADTLAATTAEERQTKLEGLSQTIFDEVLAVPLFFPYSPQGSQKRVEGLQSWLTGKTEFRGVTITD